MNFGIFLRIVKLSRILPVLMESIRFQSMD